MPKVRTSLLITDIKGKDGGSIWSRNLGGLYFRQNRNFGKKSSLRWNEQRNRFGSLSQTWRTLTANQQLAWNNAAPNFPATDAFGNPRQRSGYETYMFLNGTLDRIGITILVVPPAPEGAQNYGLPQVAASFGGTVVVTWPILVIATRACNVYAGSPVSPGRSFNTAKMKLMGTVQGVGLNTLDITVPWTQQFGAIPSSGRIYVEIEGINTTTGEHEFKQHNFTDIGVAPTTGIGVMIIGTTFTVT